MRFSAALLLALVAGAAGAATYLEGTHFKRLPQAHPTSVSKGQVEVIEFFSWGCPHCYTFEPFLQQRFLKSKPKNVVFVRVPASFNPAFRPLATSYYVAESLGVLEKVNQPMFEALHLPQGELRKPQENLLTALQKRDAEAAAEAQRAFDDAVARIFRKHAGVKEKDYHTTLASIGVKTKIGRAENLYRRYQITGVPNVVVGGKYYVGAGADLRIENYAQYADVVAWLAAREAAAAK
jgi:thiol:disulfide interchange protein DsbA